MAVRNNKFTDSAVMDVHLKNGHAFHEKDFPQDNPSEHWVTFWNMDRLVCFPISEVAMVVVYEPSESEEDKNSSECDCEDVLGHYETL